MPIPYSPDYAEVNKFPIPDPEGGADPIWVSYEQFVCNLVKARGDREKDLEHMLIGIGGEAGELMDGIKKNSIYGKPLERKNIVEELGDLEFYMAGLRQMLGISRYETLASNVTKLAYLRYKNGYSDQAAIDRADKNPAPAELVTIDMSTTAVEGADSMAASLEPQPVIEDWCGPLLMAYHAGKIVQAISYSKNTATVLFVGDSNPYKLYRPKGEV